MIQTRKNLPLLESILGERAETIGPQYQSYKNHVYRVLNFCFAFHECRNDDEEKLIVAGCFHDLGIWPGDVVDYLASSIALVQDYLRRRGKSAWSEEISEMIDSHHKVRRARDSQFPLVEVFRKGDWVDATQGLRRFGLPHADVRAVQSALANLGFHRNLLRLTWAEVQTAPLESFAHDEVVR